MASLDFLLQAVTKRHHASVLKNILLLKDAMNVIGSVAFVRSTGVDVVKDQLKALGKKARFYVGIRNDITTYQGVQSLVDLGVSVYGVDTGSRHTIFHPKIFMSVAETRAEVIIGSANLTFGGLYNNIEAGVLLSLDLLNAEDKKFIEQMSKIFADLPKSHPEHVFPIKTKAAIEALFNEGRLADETVVKAPSVSSSVKKGQRDSLPKMKLKFTPPPSRKIAPKPAAATPAPAQAPVTKAKVPASLHYSLVWQSKPLKRRALNIPTGARTKKTGSMLWTKGLLKVDQRHFFRDDTFVGLNWGKDSKMDHYERSQANFEIIIKGVNFGVHELRLSHNTNTASKAYKKDNSMTQVHWGDTESFVAKEDLLGRTMSLYRRGTTPPEFIIEID